jgi:hypothetical protein
MRRLILLIVLPLLALCVFTRLARSGPGGTIQRADLAEKRVYAYRDWQSVGVILHGGDRFTIKAEGEWLYTPVGDYNGPEGHKTYWAPDFYPLPGGPRAGCLIGRIGESGQPFYVGRRYVSTAVSDGTLYLRINDDILGDNQGALTVVVTVEKPEQKESGTAP